MKQFFSRQFYILIIGLIFVLSLAKPLYTNFFLKPIQIKNDNFLEQTEKETWQLFVTLSAAKSTLAIIEGSEVFGIQIGDIAQPLYDLTHYMWLVTFASLIYQRMQNIILTAFSAELMQILLLSTLIIAFITYSVTIIFKKRLLILLQIRALSIILSIVIPFCIPLFAMTAHYLNTTLYTHYLQPQQEALHKELEQLQIIQKNILNIGDTIQQTRSDLLQEYMEPGKTTLSEREKQAQKKEWFGVPYALQSVKASIIAPFSVGLSLFSDIYTHIYTIGQNIERIAIAFISVKLIVLIIIPLLGIVSLWLVARFTISHITKLSLLTYTAGMQ